MDAARRRSGEVPTFHNKHVLILFYRNLKPGSSENPALAKAKAPDHQGFEGPSCRLLGNGID
ncbi:hypothetical protein, partial [Xanthomonas vesicatoria]|uniref:hypothetical protein n=1 Tax=Xanthomonas vesicatoria TaxID=56460 RepID=UPI0019D300C3